MPLRVEEGVTDNYSGSIGVNWNCPYWARIGGHPTHWPQFQNFRTQRVRVMLRYSGPAALRVWCLSPLAGRKWRLIQCGTHTGAGSGPRSAVRGGALAAAVSSGLLRNRPGDIQAPALLEWLNRPFCVWAKWGLSRESTRRRWLVS